MQPPLAAGIEQRLDLRNQGILRKHWEMRWWAGSTYVFEHSLSEQGWVVQLNRGMSPGFCSQWLNTQMVWSGLEVVRLQAGLVLKSSKKLFSFIFICDPSKACIMLFLSDLMQFSHENWMPCSGLSTINIGVSVKRGLRQHFSVYWGADKSVHQNIVTGNWEHNLMLHV